MQMLRFWPFVSIFVLAFNSAQPPTPSISAQTKVEPAEKARLLTEASADQLDSFQGIKWGSSQQEARAILKIKGATFSERISTTSVLFVHDLKIAGEEPSAVYLRFGQEGLYQARIKFREPKSNHVLSEYEYVKGLIKVKYGPPFSDLYLFKSPFKRGDGDEELAIKSGKATIGALWLFKDGDERRALMSGIDDDLQTFLLYEDVNRRKKEDARLKTEKAKDL